MLVMLTDRVTGFRIRAAKSVSRTSTKEVAEAADYHRGKGSSGLLQHSATVQLVYSVRVLDHSAASTKRPT